MTTNPAFEAAIKRYHEACNGVEKLALVELRRIVSEHFPEAAGITFYGEYGEDGTLNVDIASVQIANGATLTEDSNPEAWQDMDDAANEYTIWLEIPGEDYLGETPITFDEITEATCQCGNTGYLLNQAYGYAAIPDGWTPVQACDDCKRFATDEDAAIQASRDTNVGSTQYVSFSYFKAETDADDEGEDHPGDWAIHWKET
jgi:hypothetical protein